MLLTIDVGNSNTVVGAYGPDSDVLVDHWRVSTVAERTADEWLLLLQGFLRMRATSVEEANSIVLGSVVPSVTQTLKRMCQRLDVKPLVVDWQTPTGMPILLDDPREVGPDRIANAIAAHSLVGGPSIVVDLGTATTLDVVSSRGEYLGGIIIPGIEISLDALFHRAAALKRVDLTSPSRVVGKNTVDAVRSGATYGYAAQVDGLCARISQEIGPCRILSTGGLSGVITPLSRAIERHEPWLTLQGLRIIHQRVSSKTGTHQ